jgi:hypothetical protein
LAGGLRRELLDFHSPQRGGVVIALGFIPPPNESIGINRPISARQVITIAEEPKDHGGGYKSPKLRALLMEQVPAARSNTIDSIRLGIWLQRIHGPVYDGLRIDVKRTRTANQYVLTTVDDEQE